MLSLKLSNKKKQTILIIVLTILCIVVLAPRGNKDYFKSELPMDESISEFLSSFKDSKLSEIGIEDEEIKSKDDNYPSERLFLTSIKIMCKQSIKKIEVKNKHDSSYEITVSGTKLKLKNTERLKDGLLKLEKEYEEGTIGKNELRGKLITCICSSYEVESTNESFSLDFTLKCSESGEIINKMSLIKNLLEESGVYSSTEEYQNYYDTVREQIRKELLQ